MKLPAFFLIPNDQAAFLRGLFFWLHAAWVMATGFLGAWILGKKNIGAKNLGIQIVWMSMLLQVHLLVFFGKVQTSKSWVFPNIGVPDNGWFIVEHPIKVDDLGIPLCLEIPSFFLNTVDGSEIPFPTTWDGKKKRRK